MGLKTDKVRKEELEVKEYFFTKMECKKKKKKERQNKK